MASGTKFSFTRPAIKPVTEFDASISTTSGRKEVCVQRKEVGFNHGFPQDVLLASLLEHLCNLYESDPKRAKQLFDILCKKLEKLNVMSPVAYMDEYASVRVEYKTSFYNLIQSSLLSFHANCLYSVEGSSNHVNNEGQLMEFTKEKVNPKDVFNFGASRYKEEFEEIEVIGAGAFGKVFRVLNKMDGQEYAVKKIICKNVASDGLPETNKMLREVQSLASLQHENIIGYHCAWIEHSITPISEKVIFTTGAFSTLDKVKQPVEDDKLNLQFDQNSMSECNGSHLEVPGSPFRLKTPSQSHSSNDPGSWGDYDAVNEKDGLSKFWQNSSNSSTEDSVTNEKKKDDTASAQPTHVIFTEGVMKTKIRRVQSFILTGVSTDRLSSFNLDRSNARSLSVNSMQDIAILKKTKSSPKMLSCYKPSMNVVIYIQMQLCSTTLKKWLVARNDLLTSHVTNSNHVPASFFILKQIISALSHIHSKGLLHRDVKPQNVFIVEQEKLPQIKLGDFGLARSSLPRNNSDPLTPLVDSDSPLDFSINEHTSGVGTSLYASPEQLNGESYNEKADIYSVGIIFYELICPVTTAHERMLAIQKLRKQEIPEEFVKHTPSSVDLLQSILCHDHGLRPSACDLLVKLESIPEAIVDIEQQNKLLLKENHELQRLVNLYKNELIKNGHKIPTLDH
uniref:eukaryotic translation initiation factor 2-alpha kinase 1-like n=1 Tax=Ciona intestinalis TaxID=7719 RepID=UPI000180BB2C|nr:eukaryotic translation initiation factor 2-alpha kinase 1-like [Ciona intestinalis]|eukprot:XP_009859602.1 eukaryotic translation initiation factor 2-alpha kinase 1-like [Ciona intestinalis]